MSLFLKNSATAKVFDFTAAFIAGNAVAETLKVLFDIPLNTYDKSVNLYGAFLLLSLLVVFREK